MIVSHLFVLLVGLVAGGAVVAAVTISTTKRGDQ